LEKIGLEIICPWRMTSPNEVQAVLAPDSLKEQVRRYGEFELTVGKRTEEGIRKARIVIANLDGTDVDAGTAAEIGFAYAIGRTCYGWRSDWRRSGELCGGLALQVSYFIRRSGGLIAYGELELFIRQLDMVLDPLRTDLRQPECVRVSIFNGD
jgi:nucleoside 2-deoxyribosyltransferase